LFQYTDYFLKDNYVLYLWKYVIVLYYIIFLPVGDAQRFAIYIYRRDFDLVIYATRQTRAAFVYRRIISRTVIAMNINRYRAILYIFTIFYICY